MTLKSQVLFICVRYACAAATWGEVAISSSYDGKHLPWLLLWYFHFKYRTKERITSYIGSLVWGQEFDIWSSGINEEIVEMPSNQCVLIHPAASVAVDGSSHAGRGRGKHRHGAATMRIFKYSDQLKYPVVIRMRTDQWTTGCMFTRHGVSVNNHALFYFVR